MLKRISSVVGGALLGALVAAACSSGSNSCPLGYAGCACTPEGTCLSNLLCTGDNLCTDPGTLPGSGGGAGAPGTGGRAGIDGSGGGNVIDVEGCRSCWQSECQREHAACQAVGACGEAVECLAGCLGEGDSACDHCTHADDFSAEEEEAFFAFSVCATFECSEYCGECTENEVPRGSCQADEAEICLDGIWQTEDCTGCSLLEPEEFCGHIRAMVLDPATEWSIVPRAVDSFEQTEEAMTATFNFTAAGQLGVIQYRFTHPIPLRGVTISRTPLQNVDLTVETANSHSGCQYSLDGNGVADQNPNAPAFDGCWENDGSFSAFIPNLYAGSPAALMNIRLTATAPGPASLTIESVDLDF